MKYTTKSFAQRLANSFLLFTVFACAPASIASAQFFNSGGAVPNWLNQSLPGSSFGQSNYSSAGASSYGSTGLLSSNVGMQNWQIGVIKQDMDVGTLVKGVQSNSPAAQAGIKNDDLIVTINGQQVGNTPKGLVDIGVLANQIANNGKIVALVADGLTGKLKNVTIDLAQTATKLEGQVRVPNTGYITSYLTVTLKNVSRPLYEVVGGKISQPVSGGGVSRFQMQIDPNSIVPSDKYQLEARVDDGRSAIQYYSLVDIDINRVRSGTAGFVTLDLEPYQQWIARNTNNGQVVQAGYNGTNLTNDVVSSFQSIIGRVPNAAEVNGWSNFILEGNNLNEMRVRLISHQSFYDSVNDDPMEFIVKMISVLNGRQANANEVSQWSARFAQLQGNRDALVREYLNTAANAGQLR